MLSPVLSPELEALTTFSAGFTREVGAGPRTSLCPYVASPTWALGYSPALGNTSSGGGIPSMMMQSLSAGKVFDSSVSAISWIWEGAVL